jgi:membrane protein implicated in regulation of membrane protease activity
LRDRIFALRDRIVAYPTGFVICIIDITGPKIFVAAFVGTAVIINIGSARLRSVTATFSPIASASAEATA